MASKREMQRHACATSRECVGAFTQSRGGIIELAPSEFNRLFAVEVDSKCVTQLWSVIGEAADQSRGTDAIETWIYGNAETRHP